MTEQRQSLTGEQQDAKKQRDLTVAKSFNPTRRGNWKQVFNPMLITTTSLSEIERKTHKMKNRRSGRRRRKRINQMYSWINSQAMTKYIYITLK